MPGAREEIAERTGAEELFNKEATKKRSREIEGVMLDGSTSGTYTTKVFCHDTWEGVM